MDLDIARGQNHNYVKGIGYPKLSNFSILLFYAQNEAVCVKKLVWQFQTNWTKNEEVIAYTIWLFRLAHLQS